MFTKNKMTLEVDKLIKKLNKNTSGDATVFSIVVGIVIVFAVITLFASAVDVEPGHEAVIVDINEGVITDRVLPTKLNWIVPYFQSAIIMDVRTVKKEVTAEAVSNDIQKTTSIIALNYHPTRGQTPFLLDEVGASYEEVVIAPAIQEVVKAVTAKYTAPELVENRELVSLEMKEMLSERLKDAYITVDYFSIVDFQFTEKYTDAIEDKQVAEVSIQTATNDLRRIEIEKQQKIAAAQGDAEAIRIKGEALEKSPTLVLLEAVYAWDGKLPWMLMVGGEEPMNVPDLIINSIGPVAGN